MPFMKSVTATVSTGAPFRSWSGFAAATYGSAWMAASSDDFACRVSALIAGTTSRTFPCRASSARIASVGAVFRSTLTPIVFEVEASRGARLASAGDDPGTAHASVSTASAAATNHRMYRFILPSI